MLSKKTYVALSCTWGIIMTLIGSIAYVVLVVAGKKPIKNKYGVAFMIGSGWGGLDIGPVAIVNENPTERILNHEFGHSIQNCYFGPLFPFLIAIPSVIRYWYREYLVRSGKKKSWELPPYDSIWFEGDATRIGSEY